MNQTLASGTVDLAGSWALQDHGGDHACAMAVPGDAISALVTAGLAPEPYFADNEYDLRWIAERDWVMSRNVTLTDTDVELVISGLDCVAEVHWNGQQVLSAANAFRHYRVNLRELAKIGENTVQIYLRSPVARAAEAQARQPFFVPYAAQNCPIPHGNMLRKPACDYGWDWNIALAPIGLYGDIRLEPASRPRVADLRIAQRHDQGQVTLTVSGRVAHARGDHVVVAVCGQEVKGQIADGSFTATIEIENPVLWWPAGQGPQALHDLTITAGGATTTRRIGLRHVELDTSTDAAGSRFAFRINGREVFAKGANWIPADALAGRISRDGVRDLLQSAVDAHMNMIRVWGGGRYEPDWFYDFCDEMGLMVWQDFMFACNLYPSTPEFLAEVEAEVAENVARLAHHPSITLWCGDNELVGALTWFPESRENRDRYLVSYDRLNRCIETALKRVEPDALWWPSSPCPGPLDFGDSWHSDGSGDMHFWSVWHEGRDFDHYRDVSPRFCSEFGFQSYPSMDVIRGFADEKDWNIASPVFESHQKNKGGNARIAETMFRYFRWPERFEDFVWLSQIQQALAIKTAVTHWRSLKPHCMGTLYWQLNDTWPVCSWSSLDHGGGWKMLHYQAQRFFAPLTVVAVPEAESYRLVGVNDGAEPVHLTVTARAVNMANQIRDLGKGTALVGGASETLLTIDRSAVRPDELLTFIWETPEGQRGGDHFAPRPYKAYDLPAPNLQTEVNGNAITLSAENLALFVSLEADQPGRFSTNAFTVFPGYPQTVTFIPRDPTAKVRFTVRDLHTATMASRKDPR